MRRVYPLFPCSGSDHYYEHSLAGDIVLREEPDDEEEDDDLDDEADEDEDDEDEDESDEDDADDNHDGYSE